ncbi:STM4011 family radical SAM protein [Pendulispora rubella]|uniref:STM4011 family radical SAM protein n=1 Tax=Pendulispora rubella TaxID=2741070 RepID=A0ABZ2L9I8_9BACT
MTSLEHLSILYRGPLSSCNYGCTYCPFAKRHESAAELEGDRRALRRFVAWCTQPDRSYAISILFTPWGEALVHAAYRDALAILSHASHVRRVAIQTNLSFSPDWLHACNLSRLALWVTYHPTEVRTDSFLSRCRTLVEKGVRFSVGAVGVKEHLPRIEDLRRQLPPEVYLWVNAVKELGRYYDPVDLARITAIDPLFGINVTNHRSRGRACRTGSSVIAVDGEGTIRRCHFVDEPLGNLYEADFESRLSARPCPKSVCRCHTGYVHLEHLDLDTVFGGGALERIPLL